MANQIDLPLMKYRDKELEKNNIHTGINEGVVPLGNKDWFFNSNFHSHIILALQIGSWWPILCRCFVPFIGIRLLATARVWTFAGTSWMVSYETSGVIPVDDE